MKIAALIQNSKGSHSIRLQTGDNAHSIDIPPKPTGFGSSANGGELLFLALATCYCNDIYREASKMGIQVEQVEVEVDGDFGPEGTPAENVTYRAKVAARASADEIRKLMLYTDQVAEIHNTLRAGVPVILKQVEVDGR